MGRNITNVSLTFKPAPRPRITTAAPVRSGPFEKPYPLGGVVDYKGKDFVVARTAISPDGVVVYDLIRNTGGEIEYVPTATHDDIKAKREDASSGSMNYAYNLLIDKMDNGTDYTRGPF